MQDVFCNLEGGVRARSIARLSPNIEAHLVVEYRSGNYSVAELAEQFSIARSTVYRAVQRAAVLDARLPPVTLPIPVSSDS